MKVDAGSRLRAHIEKEEIVPLVWVCDVFSASIAAKYCEGIFISGFSFAASHYGLRCLFDAQAGVEQAMATVRRNDGRLQVTPEQAGTELSDCTEQLYVNLEGRYK